MEQTARAFFRLADIDINGERPWDIQVNNQKFYSRVLAGGSLALGESYMDGWWECEAIDQLIDRILRARLHTKIRVSRQVIWNIARAKVVNQQRKARAHVIGERHYDIGNDLYKSMLDKGMNYSCAFWENARTLDEAQEAKLGLICRKLKLEPGMTLLDIGCGWGGLARFAAEEYQVKVLGITVSREQANLAEKLCEKLPVEIRLQDYRELKGEFDRIVSVGMIEHVGYKNYRTYMKAVNRCLKPRGLFLLHTIGGNTSMRSVEPWINEYIFPDSMLPSAKQITTASEGLFVLEDWHSFGTDYDKTLMAWYRNFDSNWDDIKGKYDERFHRMWEYYLLSCAGSFRSYNNQLWQIMFSRFNSQVDYRSIR